MRRKQGSRSGDSVPEIVGAMEHQSHGGITTQAALNGYIVPANIDVLERGGLRRMDAESETLITVACRETAATLSQRMRGEDESMVGNGGRTHSRQLMTPKMAVRRLTVVECCRLQGFPDTATFITRQPRKIDGDEAAYLHSHGLKVWQRGEQWMTDVSADGPMYKALGNSMAVPVMRWIGRRIMEATSATPHA